MQGRENCGSGSRGSIALEIGRVGRMQMPTIQQSRSAHNTAAPMLLSSAQNDSVSNHRSKLAVSIDPSLEGTPQESGFRQLLLAADIATYQCASQVPDIYYGADQRFGERAALWVRSRCDIYYTGANWIVVRGLAVPEQHARCTSDFPSRRIELDLGALTAFWLSLDSERFADFRDEHGRPPSQSTLLSRLGLLDCPPIQAYAVYLRQTLSQCGVEVSPIDRWPDGCRWAVVMTHDVDEPEIPNSAYPHVRKVILGSRGGRREAYWSLRAELRKQGLAQGLLNGPESRREWDFDRYCEVEAASGIRSTFLFSVVQKSAGHTRDVTYDARLPRYRRLMKRLLRGNWEIGLHASYETIEERPPLLTQVGELESISGIRPAAMRHHYLRLDGDSPTRSLLHAESAGISCDCSVGFNNRPGFRAGTSLPYFPTLGNSESGKSLIELPMSLADMHLLPHDSSEATNTVLGHLATVRELGGMAVLNWHAGNWHSKPAWRESFKAICEAIQADSAVWCATASQAANWWRSRERRLAG